MSYADDLLAAMREVDAITPGSPPIAPPSRPASPSWHAGLGNWNPTTQVITLNSGRFVSREWLELHYNGGLKP